MNVLLKSALKYVEVLGWHVLPVEGKLPLTEHGALDASLDPVQVREWWKQWPNANIALATGIKFWALDSDFKTGGTDSLEDLEARYSKLADTIQQMTGGGGRQFLWNPPNFEVRNSQGAIAPGIDVRGHHGYIVAPPSTHPETHKQYIWDGAAELKDQRILDAPPWLLDLVKRSQEPRKGNFEVPPKIPKGVQHATLVGFSGKLRNMGLEPEEIFPCILEINRRRCAEPGPEKNIRKIAESMRKYAPGKFQMPNGKAGPATPVEPHVVGLSELRTVEAPMGEMMFDTFPLPAQGLTLMVGAAKGGKTVLGVQIAIAVASGTPLFDNYAVVHKGPVLVIERDDKAGVAGIKPQVMLSGCADKTLFYCTAESPEGFGPAMEEWLEKVIAELELKLVLIDSYTTIRAARSGPGDIVKLEAAEVAMLDALAKRRECAIALIHHQSITGATRPDWTLAGSGTFAMFGGAEALMNISRFPDLDSSPERLVRMRGRRSADHELVLRFEKPTLNYRHILDGPAAPLFPLLRQIHAEFGYNSFGVKDLINATGMVRPTAFRQISRLRHTGAVEKRGHGDYVLAVSL